MASMRHPNIVAFMGVCITPPAIVTEYCERGSLTSLLQAAKALPERAAELTWRYRVRMVRSWPLFVLREDAAYLQFVSTPRCRCMHTLSSPMHTCCGADPGRCTRHAVPARQHTPHHPPRPQEPQHPGGRVWAGQGERSLLHLLNNKTLNL